MDRQCKGVMVHRHRRRGKADTVKLSECPAVGVMNREHYWDDEEQRYRSLRFVGRGG